MVQQKTLGTLKFEELELLEKTFWNKLSIEVKFRIGIRLFGLIKWTTKGK